MLIKMLSDDFRGTAAPMSDREGVRRLDRPSGVTAWRMIGTFVAVGPGRSGVVGDRDRLELTQLTQRTLARLLAWHLLDPR